MRPSLLVFMFGLGACGGRVDIAANDPPETPPTKRAPGADASSPPTTPVDAASDVLVPDAAMCSGQCQVSTVCNLENPTGILCGGDPICTTNPELLATTYCNLAGFTRVVSYTKLSAWSGLACIHFNGSQPPTSCNGMSEAKTFGAQTGCAALTALVCE